MSFFHTNSELFAAFRESTNSIFGWLWLGMVLLVVLSSQLSPLLHIFFRPGLASDDVARITFLYQGLSTLILAILIIARFLGAYASPKKPYGVGFHDILKLGILGPFAPDIRDYEEQ